MISAVSRLPLAATAEGGKMHGRVIIPVGECPHGKTIYESLTNMGTLLTACPICRPSTATTQTEKPKPRPIRAGMGALTH